MKNLGKWQVVSIGSRFVALFLGLVQSVVITRILTVSEFGLVGIVSAVGALFGIAQHLGLASGTTREISATEDKEEVFKIFVSSVVIKYLIVFPVATSLFFLAHYLAYTFYNYPDAEIPLKLYSIVLVIQGAQGICNSVIAGLQKFRRLFLYQAVIALVSLFFYIPFVEMFKVRGYFIALTLFNLVSSISLLFLALYPIKHYLKMPKKKEFVRVFKNVLLLSLSIYLVKVLYTLWLKFGQVTLGRTETLEMVGIFSFAILYSSKLLTISDALTDVNLPIFSKEFSLNLENFKKMFLENFGKLYLVIMFAAVSAIFMMKDIIGYVGLSKYNSAAFIVMPLVLSFAFYSYINLVKSSVLIPAKMMIEMISGYVAMLVVTVIAYFLLKSGNSSLNSMSFAMLLGSLASFLLMGYQVKRKLHFFILDNKTIYLSVYLFILLSVQYSLPSTTIRALFYIPFSLLFLYLIEKFHIMRTFSLLHKLRK